MILASSRASKKKIEPLIYIYTVLSYYISYNRVFFLILLSKLGNSQYYINTRFLYKKQITMATESSITIMVLTFQNYLEWFDGIKQKVEALKIWTYINPDTAIQAPRVTPLPELSSIQINTASIIDLSSNNQSILTTQLSLQKTYNDHTRQIKKTIQIIYKIIKKSTINYNTVILRTNSVRLALQALRDYLKPIQFEAEEALRHKYYKLCKSPAKKTIEDQILKQVALQNNIACLDILDILDTMLACRFLKDTEKQASAMTKTQDIYK